MFINVLRNPDLVHLTRRLFLIAFAIYVEPERAPRTRGAETPSSSLASSVDVDDDDDDSDEVIAIAMRFRGATCALGAHQLRR